MVDEKLRKLRDTIDKIDVEILRLLNERAKIAIEIAETKKAKGLSFYDPVRKKV